MKFYGKNKIKKNKAKFKLRNLQHLQINTLPGWPKPYIVIKSCENYTIRTT